MADAAIGMTLLTISASVVGTLGVTYFGNWLALSKETKLKQEDLDRRARYLATRVVCMLDPLVMECVDVVYDEGDYIDGELTPQVMTPKVSFPEDIDWQTIKPDIMYRILTLPNEVGKAERSIAAYAEHSGPPNYDEVWEERKFQYGRIGLAALDLATELRGHYGMEPLDYGDWDPRKVFHAAYLEEDVRRKKVAAGIKGMLAKGNKKKAAEKKASQA